MPSAISIKLQNNFIEIALRHGCSPVNLLHIFRTPFQQNTSEGLLLYLSYYILVQVLVSELIHQYVGEGYNIDLICTPRSNENISAYEWDFGGYMEVKQSDTFSKTLSRNDNGKNVTCKPLYGNGQTSKKITGVLQVVCKFPCLSYLKKVFSQLWYKCCIAT